ncbi:MAG: hypothetical protein RLZZ546_1297 [Bacteroidota bacterium]|jgi:uncharacterized protein (DUF58 family)
MDTTELLKKVKKIEIKAKGKSQDVFSGAYHTAFKGRGMSFAETRAYQYGDDIRNIDWNVTAKTGEPQIKVYEEERELTIMLLIDVSPSGFFGSNLMKKDFIAEMACVIAINALKNNDKVGAILFSDKIEKYIPPKKGRKNILHIVRDIVLLSDKGNGTNIGAALSFLNNLQKKKSVCFIFSDFIDENYETSMKIISKRHDLIPVRVHDPRECHIPNLGLVQFFDSENNVTQLIDTGDKNMVKKLAQKMEYFSQKFIHFTNKYGIDGLSIGTNEDYIKAFLKYFKKR